LDEGYLKSGRRLKSALQADARATRALSIGFRTVANPADVHCIALNDEEDAVVACAYQRPLI
jgi:hypothetical protein